MKKSLLSVLVLSVLAIGSTGFSQCTVPQLPSQFKMKEKIISLTTALKIVSPEKKTVGKVTEKFFALTKSFYYDDANKNRIASARQRFWAWGVSIDVVDCQGNKIGTIKEEIFKSLFKVYTSYKILDAQDRQIATSEKVDWLATDVTVRDETGRALATLHRPFINIFYDTWTVNIIDSTVVDPRLIVMISAYKTSVDNDRRHAAAAEAAKQAADSKN